MLRRLALYIILFSGLVNAQAKTSPLFIEHNSINVDSQKVEIISYRIPYNNLLFIKADDKYSASFTLTLELYNEEEFILREIVKQNLSTDNYEVTLSKDQYFQDFISLSLSPGSLTIKTILSLEGTDLEYKIPDQKIEIDSLLNFELLAPIIVSSKINSDNKKSFTLCNFGQEIPFTSEKYSLLIGIKKPDVDNVSVSISQFDKEIFSSSLSKYDKGELKFEKKNDYINVSIIDSSNINFFLISDFSHLLFEGIAELIVTFDSTENKYPLNISWFGKPDILNNPEYSIKLLSYIEEEIVLADLLSSDEDKYYKKLSQYWIHNYPANGMKFNYAMDEYYSRADYAVKNFSSLNSFDGAERDRGKIHVLYGEPSSLERNYTEMNEIVEIWTYENAGRTFVFKDVNGTGKFDLVE
jgi:GWxTD domain-containing protein